MICNRPCSADLQYHIDNSLSLHQSIFRYGSESWAKLIQEARSAFDDGDLQDIDEEDFSILESDMGVFVMFEGEEVLLDTPEVNWDRPGWMYVYVRTDGKISRLDYKIKSITGS